MTTIKLKNGSGAPLATDLVQGEVALDLTNKRIYSENASGTVIEMGTSPSTIDINAGTIDGTVIGGASAAAGTFTTLNATGGGALTGTWSNLGTVTTVDINGGTIDGVTIGGASAGAGTFTTLNASGRTTSVGRFILDRTTSDAGTTDMSFGSLSGGVWINTPSGTSGYLAINGASAYQYNSTLHAWRLSGSEAMRLTSTGLGIGTSSPNYVATLYKASLPVLQLANSTSGSTAADGLLIYLNGANATISNEEAGSIGFQTSGTLRATLDSSGNLGLGVTPSAWGVSFKAFEINTLGGLTASGTTFSVLFNSYYDGTSYTYRNTGDAGRYQIGSSHKWYTAPSGTAGNAITFTQAMTLDASGNLLVGTTSANGSTSNGKPVVAGAFRSLNGTLTSLASGTAYTMFTASADFATWMVNVHCIVSNAIYSETAIVQINNSSVRVDIISAGSTVAISNSGLDIQVTQTSGTTQSELIWSAVRMA